MIMPMSVLKGGTPVKGENSTNNTPNLGDGARQEVSYYYWHIGSRIRAFKWYRNYRWPWMTFNGVMAVILHWFTEFSTFNLVPKTTHCLKLDPLLSATECRPKNRVFGNSLYDFYSDSLRDYWEIIVLKKVNISHQCDNGRGIEQSSCCTKW